jgi:hypothetical protein
MSKEARTPRRFLFHAEAVAYAARIDAPRLREVKGAIALPGIGGRAHAHAQACDSQALVRFDYAVSSVSGERRGDAYETRAACTIEGLEIGRFLRADVLSAVLTSRYQDEHTFHEESVSVKGLWVNGQGHELHTATLDRVRECPTFPTLKAALARDKGLAESFLAAGGPADAAGQPVESSGGELACFLLEPRGSGAAPLQCDWEGRQVQVFLGEYMIAARQRRLTLIRVEMREAAPPPPPPRAAKQSAPGTLAKMSSAPCDSSLTFGEMRINGDTYP